MVAVVVAATTTTTRKGGPIRCVCVLALAGMVAAAAREPFSARQRRCRRRRPDDRLATNRILSPFRKAGCTPQCCSIPKQHDALTPLTLSTASENPNKAWRAGQSAECTFEGDS